MKRTLVAAVMAAASVFGIGQAGSEEHAVVAGEKLDSGLGTMVYGEKLDSGLGALKRSDLTKYIDVSFQFANTSAPMVIGRFNSLPEAMRAVTQVPGVDESASDEDRYVFQDHRTSRELLTLNVAGLRALQAK